MSRSLVQQLRERLQVVRLASFVDEPQLKVDARAVTSVYARWLNEEVTLPEKPVGELRPCHFTSVVSHVDEVSFVHRALLASESVALIIPDSINYPLRLFRLVTQCEGLIDCGLLFLVPEAQLRTMPLLEEQFGMVFNGKRIADQALRSPGDRAASADDWVRTAEIAASLDACNAFPGRVDLALTSRRQTDIVRQLFADSIVQDQAVAHDRLVFLPDLLSIPLPVLDLAPKDLLAVRRDGYMEELRIAIRDATEAAATLDESQLLEPSGVIQQEFRNKLEQAADRAHAATRRSRTLRRATVGVGTFSVGCATGALGAVAGPGVAAAAGGLSVLGAAIVEWLGGRPSSGQRAFRRILTSI